MKFVKMVLTAAAMMPAAAYAQYAPFQPPGGLAPATIVGNQTLAQMQTTATTAQTVAAAAIPSSRIGTANGVAGLNAAGQLTAPVAGDVTTATVTPAGGSATGLGTYLGTLAQSSDLSAYLTVTTAGQTYATQAALAATAATASAAIPSSRIGTVGGVAGLNAAGQLTAPMAGDVTAATVTPAGGSATGLGAYLGILARSSDLSAYLTAAAAGQTYATQAALAAETTRAEGAEATLQGNINAEATARTNADNSFMSNIGTYKNKYYYTTNATLSTNQIGSVIQIWPQSGITITLPQSRDVPPGKGFSFFCGSTAGIVNHIATSGNDTLLPQSGTVTALPISAGSFIEVVSDGLGTWNVSHDGAYTPLYTYSTLPVSGIPQGYRVFVVDGKSQVQAILTTLTASNNGIPATWNGAGWVDDLGYPITH